VKVYQICHQRFHHFEVANELIRCGLLRKFVTGYPSWRVKQEILNPSLVRSVSGCSVPYMAMNRLRVLRGGKLHRWLEVQTLKYVGMLASRDWEEGDTVFAISGAGLETGRRALSAGGSYICDRGSTHIINADRVMKAEFAVWGQPYQGFPQEIVERELAEYEIATRIFVPTHFAKKTFLSHGVSSSKVCVLPYGVNTSRFKPISEPAKGSFNLLFVGQICLRKGIGYLLDAFRKADIRGKKLTLVGLLQDDGAAVIRKMGLPNGVEIVGRVPQSELARYMSSAHLLVMPSVEEGLPLVMAQALSCGCPVLATEETGIAELGEGPALMSVPSRNTDLLTQKLEQFNASPELQLERRHSALRVSETFCGWSGYGERFRQLCDRISEEK
jgi:alpha-maltose-1-phosphate synthase